MHMKNVVSTKVNLRVLSYKFTNRAPRCI
jgi:hypothetical protein